jgi:hypothetical protein
MSAPNGSAQRRPSKTMALSVIVTIGVLLMALGFASWWFHTFERVVKVDHLPPRGEAAYNPLYALKLAMNADNRPTKSYQRIEMALDDASGRFGANDTVLMLGDPRNITSQDAADLMQWVAAGGHLIVRTPPMGDTIENTVKIPILSELGLEVEADPDWDESHCKGLRVPGAEEDHVEFCEGRHFYLLDDGPEIRLSWDDKDEQTSVFARFVHRRGTIDVLADMDFLRNDKLEEVPHYALALQLFEPNRDENGTIRLIYSADLPSLLDLIWRYGWMIVAPLILALVLWLWLRTERFGPQFPSPAVERRSLLEHIQASGDHLYRYGHSGTLYNEVLQAFMNRLRRRDPYAAALEGPARVEAIARRTGISVNEVDEALRYPRPRDSRDFVLRIAKLLQLRRRL